MTTQTASRAHLVRNIEREQEAARTLLANVRDVIGDDEEAVAGTVEGETSLLEELGRAVERIGELAAFEAALDGQIEQIKARQSRFAMQAERLRTAVALALADVGLKKVELPAATVSLRTSPPAVIITSEADVPAKFWREQAPKLDKKAVSAALKNREDVPGAIWSNTPDVIHVRWS